MKYDDEVVGIVEMYEDVWDTYGTNQMPKYLRIEDKKCEVKKQTQNQCIKMYITKDMEMVNNIESIHTEIWRKCTEPLQNMIKHIKKSNRKHKEKDVICLLKNLNTVSIGIEYLGNTEWII